VRDEDRMLVEGKETVVQPRGETWAFSVPEGHRIHVSDEFVSLSLSNEGTTYDLSDWIEDDEEVRVVLGREATSFAIGDPPEVPPVRGYPIPSLDEELKRLSARLVRLGESEQRAQAWAQGASYDSHTRDLRRRIRELEREARRR